MTIREKRTELSGLVDEMNTLVSAEGDMTPEDETRFDEIDKRVEELKAEIADMEEAEKRRIDKISRAASLKDEMIASKDVDKRENFANVNTNKDEVDPEKEFRSLGEFLCSVRFNPNDKRLDNLYDPGAGAEYREQNVKNGTDGGFMVPPQFRDTLLSITPDSAIFRSRATVIPAGSPPDAELTIPVMDQTSAENVYGGVQVDWIGEGGTKTETDMKFKEITLKPHEVAAHIVTTDKLLRNWGAASSLLGAQLRAAIIGAEEYTFYAGNGVAKPLGFLNSPARINYARATANQIAYADVVGMLARLLKRGGSPMWVANQSIIPQLATIRDTGNNQLFVMDAKGAFPATLLGFPVMFNERVTTLGNTGDLSLVDMSFYLIKDGSGPFVASSEHVFFRTNKTVIKAFWNVDGQPWLSEPHQQESDSGTVGGSASTNTLSPFVVLN